MEPTEEYWALIEDRRLCFCRCRSCGHAWLPPAAECPCCLRADAKFEPASGEATLLSWVTFHRAYHDSVADRVPYVVGLVQLAEGPRLVANVPLEASLHAGQVMRLRFEGEPLRPGFVPAEAA